jgi:hypothetical protein
MQGAKCVPVSVLGPYSVLCIITMRVGCRLRMLYVKGMTIIIAAGGACNDSLDNLFTNDASKVAGKCLRCLSNRN